MGKNCTKRWQRPDNAMQVTGLITEKGKNLNSFAGK